METEEDTMEMPSEEAEEMEVAENDDTMEEPKENEESSEGADEALEEESGSEEGLSKTAANEEEAVGDTDVADKGGIKTKNIEVSKNIKIKNLEKEVFKISKKEFNIASPKQLGEILYNDLKIADLKKTKKGSLATNANVLEDLAFTGHKFPNLVLEWRQLSKLRSTYTESLQNHIKSKTGRVHTSFLSSGATTGRLSSSNPNLQNIPIRTDDGKKIRSAFIADKGKKLVSFDYSQIELRVLAHIAQIKNLINAFKDGQDI